MDLSATVEKVGKMAVDAVKPIELTQIEDPRKVRFMNPRTMEVVEVSVPPGAREHRVASIDDFIAAAKAAADGEWRADAAPIIWFADKQLVLVVDDADRHDLITTPLIQSPHYLTLSQYDAKAGEPVKRISQKSFIELLKLTLRNCVVHGDELLKAVRGIKFQKTENGGANVGRGKESMDADVVAEVVGWADVPEEWQVTFPVYWNEGERENVLSVLCHVDVDLDEQKFIFRPIPGEMDLALEKAKSMIRERLEAGTQDIPIYYGTP